MDSRTQFLAYMEDLAKRNSDIAHNRTTVASRRFFLETSYEQLMGDTEPNNKGWNMVLMGYETAMRDPKPGHTVEAVVCIFDILKAATDTKENTLQGIYRNAREIGEEILARFKEHTKFPCDAEVSAGITVPYSLLMETKRTIEVGPRWTGYYGYRFSIDVLQDDFVKTASDPAKWITP